MCWKFPRCKARFEEYHPIGDIEGCINIAGSCQHFGPAVGTAERATVALQLPNRHCFVAWDRSYQMYILQTYRELSQKPQHTSTLHTLPYV
jgi:hypothetical protein